MPFILTLSCPNRIGIVAKVSGFLFERGCDITNSAQFDDELTGRFFMRVAFRGRAEDSRDGLAEEFPPIAAEFCMDWKLYDEEFKP
ncbi:MAG: ACT domain-containing protein, partial [Ferrovibrionaceae bacterium]